MGEKYTMFSRYILFALLLFSSLYAMPSLVSPQWLAKQIDNPHLVIVDVRDKKAYEKGHIKRAVNVPVFEYLFDTKHQYSMPKLDTLQKLFSRIGIDQESKVVVYGDDVLIWAARFYWISKVLGHDEVALLKVGYGRWEPSLLPKSTKSFTPQRSVFVPHINNHILETKLSTYIAMHKEIIIDGRPPAFYKGLKSHAKRFGHIPSALNYPGSQNYDLNGSGMKPFSVLKKLYSGLPKDKKIILYCEDGADAALNFLVLKELGYDVSVYDGSWLEWGNDDNLPVEK
ncbi:Thiosulfate sulfurtransferase, rhodanese [hydrothermal vent metagenome]|uniref:Thiosulfate sulfurtransferase, rhodanese n=1 Tax=hydrothermal vent metagenome TaxID=652676 RepID=A0A1W1E6W1_9ZZZZ